jgi:hypothetical protein
MAWVPAVIGLASAPEETPSRGMGIDQMVAWFLKAE